MLNFPRGIRLKQFHFFPFLFYGTPGDSGPSEVKFIYGIMIGWSVYGVTTRGCIM